MALLFLMMQLLPAIILTTLRIPATKILHRMSPSVACETMSIPEYISDPALSEPETALYLAGKEQIRLMQPGWTLC